MSAPDRPPPGFRPFPKNIGYANSIDPLFFRENAQGVELGLEVRQQHLNGMGICHGGVIMLMADICSSWNVRQALSQGDASRNISPPTLSLDFDFVNAARSGDWIGSMIDMLEIRRSVGFAAGRIVRDAAVIARFSGTFHIPAHRGFDFDPEVAQRYRHSLANSQR